ncbi:MAG: hypothetical protein ACRYG5_03785 [Janthinobacterium lividum]
MKKIAAIAAVIALSASLSGCWWGPPGRGGYDRGHDGGGYRGDGPRGAVTVPQASRQS